MSQVNTSVPVSRSIPGAAAPRSVRHIGQKELARRWGLSTRTVERWRTQGRGPIHLKLEGRVLYRFEDIERYEAERSRASTTIWGALLCPVGDHQAR